MSNNSNYNRADFICKWVIIIGGAFLAALILTGCNTVKGIAKDVYSITEGVQNEMATDSDRDGERPSNWD